MSTDNKIMSAADAAALVRSEDTLAVPLGPGIPPDFLHALGERDDFTKLVVFGALLTDLFALFTKKGVQLRSGFFGPVERGYREAGCDIQFVPADFRRFTNIAARMKPRVVATLATPPDSRGRMSLSLHAGATVPEIHRCGADPDRILVVETNAALPRTFGVGPDDLHEISVDEADVIIESDRAVFELPDPHPSESDRRIAEHACKFITDGATLQTGIGAIPTQIAKILADGPGGDYGIHSEMFTDGLMLLHQAGKVSNRKGLFDGYSATTFALGSRALYDWLDGNELVRFLPVEKINTPSLIAANRNMIALNGALAIDLHGQVAADTMGCKQYSGVGGHMDFTSGAGLSPTGRSLICLPSTAHVLGQTVSRISAGFTAGAVVTTPRHELDIVVTEFGAAEIADLTVDELAEALIAIAHPDFRAELAVGWESLCRGEN